MKVPVLFAQPGENGHSCGSGAKYEVPNAAL